ncbi:MAG TPA: leucyl/phenylalanyl-tRNA--protein transferase, partial [Flavitalea sp.]|nr:leucyl/phenylalanyl-tRNA--protein transferase [Flavitalea sp.]
AMGGDLTTERILLAYKQGIFPWYEGNHILWWSPDPRFVLFPHELRITKSSRVLLKKNTFDFTINKAFISVIDLCSSIERKDQNGTWITPGIRDAYIRLHELGFAHSAEAWQDGELLGGLYGVRIGKVFFGESMFSKKSNASKMAFISYVEQLQKEDVRLIDCQVYTSHLETLGARMIPREEFVGMVKVLSS